MTSQNTAYFKKKVHENTINVDVKINYAPTSINAITASQSKIHGQYKRKIFIGRAVTIDKATSCTNKTDKL